jgi:hypothetical protein
LTNSPACVLADLPTRLSRLALRTTSCLGMGRTPLPSSRNI